MIRFIKKYWPIACLLFFEAIVVIANYTPHTYLAGWDNVMPEFDFKTNFMRNIVGVWQEHRGLGLLDGMSHAANTFHTLLLWIMSWVLPQSMLRYAFIFGMHLLGGIGMYVLLYNVQLSITNKNTDVQRIKQAVALLGALFYQYNPAVIQMFYAPLESFAIHFALLPWLAFTAFQALEKGTRRSYLWFFVVMVLGSTQSFIATLFLPTTIILSVIVIRYLIQGRLATNAKRAGIVCLLYVLANCYWLLPYAAGIPANAPVIQSAKINQMSSSENYLRNQAYGDLGNVLTLKGFMLDFTDTKEDGTATKLMAPWITYWESPAVFLSYLCILLLAFGILYVIKTKNTKGIVFIVLFSIGFLSLATDTPGFSELNTGIRDSIPFIREAFRFPFTKFVTFFSFSYSVLVAFGILFLVSLFRKKMAQNILLLCLGISILIPAFPSFRGVFIYPSLRVSLPSDYQKTFAFFQKENTKSRVAILPQPAYWSWKLYDFGLRGSGFLWYGIPQPTLDRAFDPWSNENENYFWELSYAVYKKDPLLLESVLSKYDIGYIVLDEHLLTTTNSYRALFIQESKELLAELPSVRKIAEFGTITVYETGRQEDRKTGRLEENLPVVSPAYTWTDNDVAYRELGDYIIRDDKTIRREDGKTITYPFRSLFTKRSVDEREFTVTEGFETIRINSTSVSTASAAIDKTAEMVFDASPSSILTAANAKPCIPDKSGPTDANVQKDDDLQYLRLTGTDNRICVNFGMPDLWHKDGYLVAVTSRNQSGRPLTFSLINSTAKHTEIETQLTASSLKSEWQTDYFILPPLSSDGKGYDVYIANDAIGREISANDIARITVYAMPYEEMIRTKINNSELRITNEQNTNGKITSIEHPNPAYYKINYELSTTNYELQPTLILSQSFDPGWKAYAVGNFQFSIFNFQLGTWFENTFPFIFGKELKDHVLVNNWENAWRVAPLSAGQTNTIILFFLPQLLEWFGFLLLPIPFLFLI